MTTGTGLWEVFGWCCPWLRERSPGSSRGEVEAFTGGSVAFGLYLRA
jgi:hypothetical protein